MTKKFTDRQEQEIVDLYLNTNLGTQKIGQRYGVSKVPIQRILREHGIEINKTQKKHKENVDIFETIDNQEKAYWLGFLAADGCNYRRSKPSNAIIGINLKHEDKSHLQKFLDFIGSDRQIETYIATTGFSNNTKMCRCQVYSLKMSYDLERHGVPPRKSLILKPPLIDKRFYQSYILGYFDGDGSIYKNMGPGSYGVSIEGTKELLEWINELSGMESNLYKRYNDSKNNYTIRCGGKHKPHSFLKPLYDICPQHLDRKKAIFDELDNVVLPGNKKYNHSVNCWETFRAYDATA